MFRATEGLARACHSIIIKDGDDGSSMAPEDEKTFSGLRKGSTPMLDEITDLPAGTSNGLDGRQTQTSYSSWMAVHRLARMPKSEPGRPIPSPDTEILARRHDS